MDFSKPVLAYGELWPMLVVFGVAVGLIACFYGYHVTGGAVGIILDGRGAPIALPRRGDDRRG